MSIYLPKELARNRTNWHPVYLVKSAMRCNASACCNAGSSSNSEAV